RCSLGPLALGTIDRVIVARAADLEEIAHQENGKGDAVLTDPGVLHVDSFAKYAVAFFRISRSSSVRRSCLRSRAISTFISSTVASSPHGSGGGASLACHARSVASHTPTAWQADLNEYPSSTTNRTASRLNS